MSLSIAPFRFHLLNLKKLYGSFAIDIVDMSANTSSTSAKSSFGQTLQFITDIKLLELEKQRLAYQEHAKVLAKAKAFGNKGDVLRKVQVLAKAVKTWTGSGKPERSIVSTELHLEDLEFWLVQAQNDPSFSLELAEGWARTLEEHIRHNLMRFDSAKLFGNLFNEWLASGDSVAVPYQAAREDVAEDTRMDTDDVHTTAGSDYIEVGRKEMHEQKEKLTSIIFDDHLVNVDAINAYLEDLFSSEESKKVLEALRKELKSFGHYLQRQQLTASDVINSINVLLSGGLMDEEKRTTLKAFKENPTVLQEVASVLNMRLTSLETWAWPKEGILVEFRRHLNGKYRAFTNPEIMDALLLHHVGISWQVKLRNSLQNVFQSKAWMRPATLTHEERHIKSELLQDDGTRSINNERNRSRQDMFFLTQLQTRASQHKPYDDLVDSHPSQGQAADNPVMVKQKLLHIMTTECYLNTAIYGTHAAVCSDLEWFGPSLPHSTILTVLEFMGMPKVWLSFVKAFLAAPLRYPGDPEVRVRKRGTPISYALSVLCGEAVIFVMDFAVNQRANGLYLYRLHDDLWLWDARASKVAAGWAEMNKYASLVGLKFNKKKTGSTYIGPRVEDAIGLPDGDIHWGFLKFDPREKRFVINQEDIANHIVEMRRQLASTKSVFGWVNTYNKYMAFIFRNLGGVPANCFGKAHIARMIDTLGRIQRELFADGTGSAVGYLRKIISERFGVRDLPEGYFYFPIGSGGLELRNTMLELLVLERQGKPIAGTVSSSTKRKRSGDHSSSDRSDDSDHSEYEDAKGSSSDEVEDDDDEEEPLSLVGESFVEFKAIAEEKFVKRIGNDPKVFAKLKDDWDSDFFSRRTRLRRTGADIKEFLTFEEYTSLRESWLVGWGDSYRSMLELPRARRIHWIPKVREMMDATSTKSWSSGVDWYAQWVVSMYGEEVVKKYGGLNAVDPNLIPVGMVQLFKTSRIKLDQ